MTDCFVLLDDCNASDVHPSSRLYTGFAGELTCEHTADLPALFDALQRALNRGLHAVGLFAYELGAALHDVDHAPTGWPLAQVLLFQHCERHTAESVACWLDKQTAAETAPAGITGLHANVSAADFAAAIARIHAYIEAGDTYQVNYTYRLRFDAFGSPLALYRRLRERQPVPYGACIALPDGRAVLSLSPELFLRHQRGELTAQPMKGTAPASGDAATDDARAQALAGDDKNRAENLMIVDLLRNDLGRVAEFGSVRVPALHEVKRYGSVLQMTSTVTAQLKRGATLEEVFKAVYPCGSITGAPKKRTMEIISEVEPAARGLYTGAIGWFDVRAASGSNTQNGATVPDFCLSVPIRTLTLQAPDRDDIRSGARSDTTSGVRSGEMGVGAGIVFDSDAADEWAECQLKARFLSGLPQTFELFETMRATHHATGDGVALLDRHLARLHASADYFGFAFDEKAIRTAIVQACAALPAGVHRMRLALGTGGITIQTTPLTPLIEPVRLLLASTATDSIDLFLRHKTSVRARYDAAWRDAEAQGAFDMLFVNEHGKLTEGGRSNLFVQLGGRWYTPPLAAGVLPGVMRAALLEDPAWNAAERNLTLADLHAAEQIVVCNALRGVLRANLAV